MTALRQEQRQSAPKEYKAEDVERLARFIGWTPVYVPEGSVFRDSVGQLDCWSTASGDKVYLGWCPFEDANEDLEVLERAREKDDDFAWKVACEVHRVWNARNTGGHGTRFMVISYLMYEAGDYSRAVLEVLRSAEETPTGGQEFPA